MASFIISVEHSLDRTAIPAQYRTRRDLVNLAQRIAAGLLGSRIELNTSSANLASAVGSIAVTHANVANADTITIGGVVITAATSGNGTTSFTIGADATADAIALAACINANPTLSKHLIATTPVAGTVTLTVKLKASIGNLIVMATSKASAFALTQLTGGTGGAEATVHVIEA